MKYAALIALLFFIAVPAFAQSQTEGDVLPGSRNSIGQAVDSPEENSSSFHNPVLLSVPFVMQAPFGVWEWPWQDFCEEASVVMSYSYVSGQTPTTLEAAYQMVKLAIFEMKTFGHEKDTTIEETKRMFREFYRYEKTRVIENPTAEMIRDELRKKNLVIVPAAGRVLENPHFQRGGPRYHMFVVKGFEGSNFVVNEPGTKFGNSWKYSEENVMEAMHDFVPIEQGSILTGAKRVLVIEI